MKRFIVEKSPNGGYQIVDTVLSLPISFISKKAPADKACREINSNHEKLTKTS